LWKNGPRRVVPFKLGWKDPEKFLRLHDCLNQNPFLSPVQLLPSLKPAPRKSQGVQGQHFGQSLSNLFDKAYFNVATKTRTTSGANHPNVLVGDGDRTYRNTTHL
jgi:hypothetical protein